MFWSRTNIIRRTTSLNNDRCFWTFPYCKIFTEKNSRQFLANVPNSFHYLKINVDVIVYTADLSVLSNKNVVLVTPLHMTDSKRCLKKIWNYLKCIILAILAVRITVCSLKKLQHCFGSLLPPSTPIQPILYIVT